MKQMADMRGSLEVRKNDYDNYYIRHDGHTYTLKIDNNNRLVLSAGGDCIVIRPLAANCVIIDRED